MIASEEEKKKQQKREYARRWREKRYAEADAKGLCRECLSPNRREGKTLCQNCADLGKVRMVRMRGRKERENAGHRV